MRGVLVAVAVLLSFPAAARGAVVTVGTGSKPGLAVDAAGTAYIAWYGTEPSAPVSLHYCRLPRGAAGCDVSLTLPASASSLSRPFVRVSGARVDVIESRYGFAAGGFSQVLQFTSNDGGATFGGASAVGTLTADEGAFLPDGSLLAASNADSGGGLVQHMPTASAPATLFPTGYVYNGTVGLSGATPVAVFADGSSQAAVRVLTGADPNVASNWSPAVPIGYADYPRLAGGPGGLFLLAGTASGGLEVRRFDGTTFSPGATVTANGDASETHLYADAGGRLHAVWSRVEVDGWHLYHSVSDDGVNWSSGSVVTQLDDQEGAARVATAADHVGYAVWSSRNAAGVPEVRVAAVGPGAPVTAPPPPTPPGPAPIPVPEFHKTVVVRVVSGVVRVRRPGSRAFVTLTGTESVPLGSTVDVKKGRLALSSVPSRTGAAQTAQFYAGVFKVTQPGGVTELRLTEALARCSRKAVAAARKPKSRKLWGDGSGAFRTRGQYSAATVRGTRWLVQDSCAGTLTRVTKGAVSVRDFVRGKTVVVRAGKRYLARARR